MGMASIAANDHAAPEAIRPGEYLKRKLVAANLAPAALAQEIDVHVQTIYNMINGTRPASSTLALKLARRFPEPPEFWLSESVAAPENPGGTPGEPRPPQARLIDCEIRALLEQPGADMVSPYDPRKVEQAAYALSVGLVIQRGVDALSEQDWMLAATLLHSPESLSGPARARIVAALEQAAGTIAYSERITLNRLESAILLMREAVRLDDYHLGAIESVAGNAKRGLITSAGFATNPASRGIFVTVLNTGSDAIDIGAGDNVVSLAIMRLSEQAESVHAQIIPVISSRLLPALKELFEYKPMRDGRYKAEAYSLGLTLIGLGREGAEVEAVAGLLAALKQPRSDTAEALEIAIRSALDQVGITVDETRSLIRQFGLTDPTAIHEAERFFRNRDDQQTVYDTVTRLRLDPAQFVIRLMRQPDATP